TANDINDAGQIIGEGILGGQRHAYLLTPVSRGIVSLTLSSTLVCGTLQTTGTVTLARPAVGSGAVVTITSNHPAIADAPATVTVPPGQATATFPITTREVDGNVGVTLTAFLDGNSVTATLTVQPLLGSVEFSPREVCSRTSTTGTVKLNCTAPIDEQITL